MRRLLVPGLSVAAALIVAFVTLVSASLGPERLSAQDATPMGTASHPIVGTWIVDTISATDTDSPEIGIFYGDGAAVGLGANRVAGGRWQVVDDSTVTMTLVTVSDTDGVGTYVVVRGTHVLDETGARWTCDDCTYTVVNSDGEVLDSGTAPASATRMPVQGPEAVGTPLSEVPVWMPMPPAEATPPA
jgi:hypothetical protein